MDKHQTIISKNAGETAEIGCKMATSLRDTWNENTVRIFCLYGDLGSGKTTFTQGFARGLGILERLLSPTYLIMKRYSIGEGRALCHLDLYRTRSYQEVVDIGIEEILADSNACVIIEWADKLETRLPNNRIDLLFSVNGDSSHAIEIRTH
jgi:tRNA threonylcarbamoyladenosine biosynthesis protein TsaE